MKITTIIPSFLFYAFLGTSTFAQSSFRDFTDAVDATLDAARESREQNAAAADVRAIFAKAKEAEDDGNVNFCGFYVGMSKSDADALVAHYALKEGESDISGDPVYSLHFSLKGVRRITKGGNSYEELCQAIANRVGNLKGQSVWENEKREQWYEYKTIDGVCVTVSESELRSSNIASGLSIFGPAAKQMSIVPRLIQDMVPIPGTTYRVGKYEVTQAQWKTIMGGNPSKFSGDNNPVDSVSFDDCLRFIAKLNEQEAVRKSGLVFRMPTKGEWEWVSGRGKGSPFGETETGAKIEYGNVGRIAWFGENSFDRTHPVGQKEPNRYGLYDMFGNVWEWTSSKDTYEPSKNILWGGGFNNSSGYRLDETSSNRPDRSFYTLGFRLWADEKKLLEQKKERDEAERKVREAREAAERKARAEREAAERKVREEHEAAERKARAEREAAEQKARDEKMKPAVSEMVANMIQIPGKNFKMGKTEVTQFQWESIMGSNPSEFKNENNPVENVSWNDCQAFLEKLNEHPASKEAGLTFRLPNYLEWEFACRAGAEGPYCLLADGKEVNDGGWFSSSSVGLVAWFDQNSDEKPHPVGAKMPNAFGLYDMHGNVWEWSSTRITDSERRVNLGGSWKSNAMRVAASDPSGLHYADPRDTRSNDLGFRLCADSPEPK